MIFEVFGYPLTDQSPEAKLSRRKAWCPFINAPCDGGGNRYLSSINLKAQPDLSKCFESGLDAVPSGVCSLQLNPSESPWVVCPRRLLALRSVTEDVAQFVERRILHRMGYPSGTKLGVWPEVKVKYSEDNTGKTFDYTFDYVLMPLNPVTLDEVARLLGKSSSKTWQSLEHSGYTVAQQVSRCFVDDFPHGKPCVVEIMTSSTSGGNKRKGTTIPMAFANAMLDKPHQAPGINYRQVWARMVSQFIVKSEVGLAWGGRTLWIMQDHLIEYISRTTALNFRDFLTETPSEVNVLGLSYGNHFGQQVGVVALQESGFYSGPIAPPRNAGAGPTFQDMIRAPVCPPRSSLIKALSKRKPTRQITLS